MTPIVVDASVVAAALFREEHADAATRLLSTGGLLAPDLIFTELASVIWKRHRRREIKEAEAEELLSDVLSLPFKITPSRALLEPALQLAMKTDRTVYDALYLALAVQNKTTLITADRRFVNALASTPLAPHVRWIRATTD
jgi:predicted nucleic acid-binding protein